MSDYTDFLAKYNASGEHPVTIIDVPDSNAASSQASPFIVIRHGDKVALVNPIGLGDHLSVDIHSFVAGDDATAGVFGMTKGARWELPETGTTSHKWNSAALVAVLIGEQGGPRKPKAGK
jgi:hypothetical protein